MPETQVPEGENYRQLASYRHCAWRITDAWPDFVNQRTRQESPSPDSAAMTSWSPQDFD